MFHIRKLIPLLAFAAAVWCPFANGQTPAPVASASPAAKTAPVATPAPSAPPQQPDSVAAQPGANAGGVVDLAWPIPADATLINPKGKNTVAKDELIQNVAHNKVSINIVWTLITGFLVMFMQAGFALVETGMCRSKMPRMS